MSRVENGPASIPLVAASGDMDLPYIVIDTLDQKPRDLAHANTLLEQERPELWGDGFRVKHIVNSGQKGEKQIVLEREENVESDPFPDVLYETTEKEDIPF